MSKTIVITGSTKGIGYGLAQEFLKLGCRVVINSRKQADVQKVEAEFASLYQKENVAGCVCDVSKYEDNQKLFDFATSKFGKVDIWINNAGLSAPRKMFWEQPVERMKEVVDANLIGTMYASRVAIQGMLEHGGQIYNMEGFGSNGRMADGLAVYGSTKSAVTYFTQSLVLETKNTAVQVCLLSPGIVITDLLIKDYDGSPEKFEKAKKVLNILGDTVETVTPYLAEKILENKDGKKVAWLTTGKVLMRFMTAGFNKRNLFGEEMSNK
jgi:NAD(P)-dependent dehydrogenase (short-subunit alcohol dehydrogenase family)